MADKVSTQSLSDLVTGAGNPPSNTPSDGAVVLQSIRAKYPQYGDMSDRDLSAAIVAKFPEYKDVLGGGGAPLMAKGSAQTATNPSMYERVRGAVTGLLNSAPAQATQRGFSSLAGMIPPPISEDPRVKNSWVGSLPNPGTAPLAMAIPGAGPIATGARAAANMGETALQTGSPTSTAVSGAASLVPGGKGVAPLLGRLTLPAVTGAAVGALDPNSSAEQGAMQGLVASAVGQGVRGVVRGAQVYKSLRSAQQLAKNTRLVSEQDAAPTAEGLAKDVGPSFSEASIRKAVAAQPPEVQRLYNMDDPASRLMALRDPAIGQQALSNMFESSDNAIKQAFGTRPINVSVAKEPTDALKLVARTLGVDLNNPQDPALQLAVQTVMKNGQAPYKTSDMPVGQVLTAIKGLKAQARNSYDPNNAALSHELRAKATALEDELVSQLPTKGPSGNLQTRYTDALKEYDRGSDAIRMMKQNPRIFSGDPKGPLVNGDELRAHLYANMQDYPPSRFPELWKAATRGVPGMAGAEDAIHNVSGPRLYGHARGMGGMGASIPTPALSTQFRQQIGQPEPMSPGGMARPATPARVQGPTGLLTPAGADTVTTAGRVAGGLAPRALEGVHSFIE